MYFTADPDANKLLAKEPLAALIGMLLDQQVTMESAFIAPYRLKARLGGSLDAVEIATMAAADLEAAFKEKPALHRFPGSMASRTLDLCAHIVERHAGRAENIWKKAKTADELFANLKALPGFGEAKARIFVGVLGKRLGVSVPGWEKIAADWASIADVDSFARIAGIRQAKLEAKQLLKSQAQSAARS